MNAPHTYTTDARDRNFFQAYILLIWLVTIAGFGLDIAAKFGDNTLQYPLIVHAHAAAYVLWLALLSLQAVLIQRGNYLLHRRLGLAAAALIPLMAVLAIAAVLVTKSLKFGNPDTRFPFMSVQFTNVLASTVLLGAAVWLRSFPIRHKRLMLMGTLVLTEPSIRRVVGYLLHGHFDDGFGLFMVETYAGTLVLMLGVGVFDLVTRHRLQPTYVLALAWCFANQLAATWLFYQPWWATYTTSLVGH